MNHYVHNQLLPRVVSQLTVIFSSAPKGTSFGIDETGSLCDFKAELEAMADLHEAAPNLQDTFDEMDYTVLEPETHSIELDSQLFAYVHVEIVTPETMPTYVRFRRPVDIKGLMHYVSECGFDPEEQEPQLEPQEPLAKRHCVVDLTSE